MSLEQIVVGLFIFSVTFILRLIFKRLDKNEQNLKDFRVQMNSELCGTYDTIKSEYKELARMIESNKQEVLTALAKVSDRSISQKSCDGKQDLWNVRFNTMMDKFDTYLIQNEKDHTRIVDTMTRYSSARVEQMADLSERISELSDCVRNIQLNKDC